MKPIIDKFNHSEDYFNRMAGFILKKKNPESVIEAVKVCDKIADAAGRMKREFMAKVTGHVFTCSSRPHETFKDYESALAAARELAGKAVDDGGQYSVISMHEESEEVCEHEFDGQRVELTQEEINQVSVNVTCRVCGAIGNKTIEAEDFEW